MKTVRFFTIFLIFQSVCASLSFANDYTRILEQENPYQVTLTDKEKQILEENIKEKQRIESLYDKMPSLHELYKRSEFYSHTFKFLYDNNFKKMILMESPTIKDSKQQESYLETKREFLVQYSYEKIMRYIAEDNTPMIKKTINGLRNMTKYDAELMADVLRTTDIYNRNLLFFLTFIEDNEAFQKEFFDLLTGPEVELNIYHRDFLGHNALHFTKNPTIAHLFLDHGVEVIESSKGEYPFIFNFSNNFQQRDIRQLNRVQIEDFYLFVKSVSLDLFNEVVTDPEIKQQNIKQDILHNKTVSFAKQQHEEFNLIKVLTDSSLNLSNDSSNKEGNSKLLRQLLDNGSSPNLKNSKDFPIVFHFIKYRDYEAVKAYISHQNFDVNIQDSEGRNIMAYLFRYGKNDDIDILLNRLKSKLNFDHVDHRGFKVIDYVENPKHLQWLKDNNFITKKQYEETLLKRFPKSEITQQLSCKNQFQS